MPRSFLLDRPLAMLVAPGRRRAFYGLLLALRQNADAVRDWQAPLCWGRRDAVEVLLWVAGVPDEAGRTTALRWLFRNITPLLAAQRALDAERSLAQAILDTAEVIVLVVEGGRVLRGNPYLTQLTGQAAQALLGKRWWLLLAEDDRRAAEEMVAGAVAGQTACRCRARLLTPGGARLVEWSAVPFGAPAAPDRPAGGEAAGGGAPRVLLVGHDITELEEAQRQAVRAERLAAVGRVMASIAHESRNLLQQGQACLDRLSWKLQDRPEALALLDRLRRCQADLAHLLEDVRGYAGPLRLELAPCELRAVLRQAWDEVRSGHAGRSAALHESGSAAAVCPADRFRLLQVFRNLLDNAFAACPAAVEVWAHWSEAAPPEAPHGVVRLSLRDNGPGLGEEQRRRLFEPFYTTKRQGTGLGLTIARRVVQAHGGDITVAAPPGGGPGEGRGAEFIIHLPRELP